MRRAVLVVLALAALAFVLPAVLGIALSLSGCTPLPPVVEPSPPTPGPLEPPPVVEPSAPACVRACARRAELRCQPSYSPCVDTCEAYASEARIERIPSLGWSPECMAVAESCEQSDACRGSGAP